MLVLNPASAEPATSGLRELVDAAPVWPVASLRAGPRPGRWPCGFQERSRWVLMHTGRPVKSPIFHVARPGGGVK
jgi:hypothetical protein